MKQALIYIEPNLQICQTNTYLMNVGAWRVSMQIGCLDNWREVVSEEADNAWDDAKRMLRSIVVSIAPRDAMIYAFGLAAADYMAELDEKWYEEDTWVSPSHFPIPENMEDHDIAALENSPVPSRGRVPGDVYRRLQASLFSEEEWWPGRWSSSGTALLFPACSEGYKERLREALRLRDYDMAKRLAFVLPSGSEKVDASTFKSNPELLDSVSLYVMAGETAKCVVGSNFYSTCVSLNAFLASAVYILKLGGYQCFRSKGIETFRKWATTGKLPSGLSILTNESLP